MKSRRTLRFKQCLAALPKDVQDSAREAYERWLSNPDYPSLKFKKLPGTDEYWEVRIKNKYRAIGQYDAASGVMIWFWIGNRRDAPLQLK